MMQKISFVARITVAFILIFYGLVWLFSPVLTRYFLADVLHQQELRLVKGSHLRYNPFLSRVTLADFAIEQSGSPVFSVDEAELDLSLYRLLWRTVYVDTFSFDGVFLSVVSDQDSMVVAGFPLSSNDEESDTPSETENKTTDASEGGNDLLSSLDIVLPELRIKASEILFQRDGNTYPLILDDVVLQDVAVSQRAQVADVSLQAKFLGGDITISADLNVGGENDVLRSEIKIQGLALKNIKPMLPASVNAIAGKLSVDVSPEIHWTDTHMIVGSDESTFSVVGLLYQDEAYDLRLKENNLQLASTALTIDGGALSDLRGSAKLRATSLSVQGRSDGATYLAFDDLNMMNVDFSSQGDIATSLNVAIQGVVMESLLVSHVASAESDNALPPLFQAKNVALDVAEYSSGDTASGAGALSLGTLSFGGVESHVIAAPEKGIATLVALPSATAAAQENSVSENDQTVTSVTSPVSTDENIVKENKNPMHIRMQQLAIRGENMVHLRDENVSPVYERVFHIDEFELNTIDNQDAALSPFHFVGRSNDYAKINLKGGVSPFTPGVNLMIDGNINEVSLPSVSPYMKDSLGFVFNSGQLDTRIDVKIKDSDIKGDLVLRMRGIDMTANSAKRGSLADTSAVPLNVALGMLKDSRGNIKLKVPLSGSVDDPSFGLNSFLMLVTKKAIASQAKSYLMQTFVPYASVVSVAITAGEFALKLRFDDLPYAPEQVDIAEAQEKYVTEFIQLMKDKEKTQVKVCGVATPEDVGEPAGSDVDAAEKVQALLTIAQRRAERFKEHVVTKGELASSRILLCQPKVDYTKTAVPHIAISL